MNAATQMTVEALADAMNQGTNFRDQIIRENEELPPRANDNDRAGKVDAENGDDPSDDPSPSAAKPVNNPVEGETDCQAPSPLSVEDGEVAPDKPLVIPEPDQAYTELHECSEAIKQAETGLENQRDKGLLLILNLYASLGFAIDKIDAYLKSKGKVAPRPNTVFPVDSMMVSDSIYPGVDREDSSVASKITVRSKAVALMRQKRLFGEAAVAFLKEQGGPTGIYNKFDNEGNLKAPVPTKTRTPRMVGETKKAPGAKEEQGGVSETCVESDLGSARPADHVDELEILPILDSSGLLARLKNDQAVAGMRSGQAQLKLDTVTKGTDPESVAEQERLQLELAKAKGASVEAISCQGIVERLRKMKVYADGELKVTEMPPSVVCKDVTTHAGFALMLVSVNDDGVVSSVANMTPNRDEFAKLIETHFDVQA